MIKMSPMNKSIANNLRNFTLQFYIAKINFLLGLEKKCKDKDLSHRAVFPKNNYIIGIFRGHCKERNKHFERKK